MCARGHGEEYAGCNGPKSQARAEAGFLKGASKDRSTVWEESRISQLRAGKRKQPLKSTTKKTEKWSTLLPPFLLPTGIPPPPNSTQDSRFRCKFHIHLIRWSVFARRARLFPTPPVPWRRDCPRKLLASCPTFSHLQGGVICLVKVGEESSMHNSASCMLCPLGSSLPTEEGLLLLLLLKGSALRGG